jgi:hypothetical protein
VSYKDIEAARAKRAEQAADREAKGKRKAGRLKRVLSEADAATKEKKRRKKRKGADVTQEAEEVTVQTSEAAKHTLHRRVHHLTEPQWHACISGGWPACVRRNISSYSN